MKKVTSVDVRRESEIQNKLEEFRVEFREVVDSINTEFLPLTLEKMERAVELADELNDWHYDALNEIRILVEKADMKLHLVVDPEWFGSPNFCNKYLELYGTNEIPDYDEFMKV